LNDENKKELSRKSRKRDRKERVIVVDRAK